MWPRGGAELSVRRMKKNLVHTLLADVIKREKSVIPVYLLSLQPEPEDLQYRQTGDF